MYISTSTLLNCKRVWRTKHKVVWRDGIRETNSESLKIYPKQSRNLTLVWTKGNKANENQAGDILAGKHRDTNNKKLQFATLI